MSNVKSAQRTLEILEMMERLRRPMRISEIAKLLDYPQSSTSVIVNSLRELGYLNLNSETHEYAPSIRVALVGGYLRFGDYHAYQVLDLLQAVQMRSGLTTILSTRNGIHVQYVYVLPAPERGIEGLRSGSMRPLTRAAPGIMLLAECSDAEIGRIVRHLNSMRGDDATENLDEVMIEVRQARQSKHARVMGRLVENIGSVAITLPVRDSFGKPMALSVAGRFDDIQHWGDDLVSLLKEAASNI